MDVTDSDLGQDNVDLLFGLFMSTKLIKLLPEILTTRNSISSLFIFEHLISRFH